MKKHLIAKDITLKILNYKYGIPAVTITAPMTYSLFDWIQIIKIYSNYGNTHDWIFTNPNDDTKSLNSNIDNLDDIKFDEFRDVAPYIYCNYGSIKMSIGARGHSKYSKVYPTIYDAYGRFPTEDEFNQDIEIEDISKRYMPKGLSSFDLNMRAFFKDKYKISEEIENSFFGEQNRLLRK